MVKLTAVVAVPLQTTCEVIGCTCPFGLTVTVTVKVVVQLFGDDAVTVYTTFIGAGVLFVSV